MANYAQMQNFSAYLNTRFGISFAQSHLGLSTEIIEALVGRYSRGKRKGQLRGMVCWEKVVRGGWAISRWGRGVVRLPGIRAVWIADAFTGEKIYEQGA